MKGRLAVLAAAASLAAVRPASRPEAPPAPAHDFERIEREILVPRCAVGGCHDGLEGVMGLDLRRGRAWESLVGRPSREMEGVVRAPPFLVAPGDPAGSYLLRKLRGGPGIVGEQMPLSGPCLTGAERERIRRWIEEGAMPPLYEEPPPPPRRRRVIKVGVPAVPRPRPAPPR